MARFILPLVFVVVLVIGLAEGVARSVGRNCDFGDPMHRIACPGAFGGMTQAQCEPNPNCCWDDGTRDTPWCFQKKNYYGDRDYSGECYYGNPKNRVAAVGSYGGISKTNCHGIDGCWDDSTPDTTWCFQKRGNNRDYSGECFYGNPKNRVAAVGAYGGISKKNCQDIGGCWDDSTPDTNWCFRRTPVTPVVTTVPTVETATGAAWAD